MFLQDHNVLPMITLNIFLVLCEVRECYIVTYVASLFALQINGLVSI